MERGAREFRLGKRDTEREMEQRNQQKENVFKREDGKMWQWETLK